MKREVYNEVGIVSTILNDSVLELKSCQKEKEEILKWIDVLTEQNILEENIKSIISKMDANLQRFNKIIDKIKKINNKI